MQCKMRLRQQDNEILNNKGLTTTRLYLFLNSIY